MKNLILVLFLLLSTACITTRTVEVPVEITKTEYIHDIQKDSVFIRDSVDRIINGDTVIIYKEKTVTKYIFKSDTVVKEDSIPKPIYIETIKEVNKLHWYQKTLMYIGLFVIIIVLIRIIKKF